MCFSVAAQDVIIMRNGVAVQAVILEVTADAVKYKRFDDLDGTTFILKKSDISNITYADGSQEVLKDTDIPVSTQTQQQPPVNQQINADGDNSQQQQPELPALTYTFGKPIDPVGKQQSPAAAGTFFFYSGTWTVLQWRCRCGLYVFGQQRFVRYYFGIWTLRRFRFR